MDTTHQNKLDAAKAFLKVKFAGLNTYIKHDKIIEVNNLSFCLKALEKRINPHK